MDRNFTKVKSVIFFVLCSIVKLYRKEKTDFFSVKPNSRVIFPVPVDWTFVCPGEWKVRTMKEIPRRRKKVTSSLK